MYSKKPIKLIYDYGRLSEAEYLRSLTAKKVIIVGPAGYLKDSNLGEYIDSFDVVVRINHALPIMYPEDYGQRTDILYHILSRRNMELGTRKKLIEQSEIDYWVKCNLKWLVASHSHMSERIKVISPMINNALNWCCIHHRFSEKVKSAIGRKAPNTGTLAIVHLLTSRLHSLNVVGFDFYSSGVYKGYGDLADGENAAEVNTKWHDIDSQKEYFKKIIIRNQSRLFIDEVLRKALYE